MRKENRLFHEKLNSFRIDERATDNQFISADVLLVNSSETSEKKIKLQPHNLNLIRRPSPLGNQAFDRACVPGSCERRQSRDGKRRTAMPGVRISWWRPTRPSERTKKDRNSFAARSYVIPKRVVWECKIIKRDQVRPPRGLRARRAPRATSTEAGSISTTEARIAVAGRKEKPMDTGCALDLRDRGPTLDPGITDSKFLGSIIGRGNVTLTQHTIELRLS